MPQASASRQDALAEMGAAMREFMARAVLFQDAVARHAGLNSTDLQTVGLLMEQGPSTPGELARHIGMTSGGSITAVVDRLERAGYVSRRRDQTDRRRVLVEADARRVMRDVGPVYGRVAARWEAFLTTLTDEQLLLAVDVIRHAALINQEEAERLRQPDGAESP
jgi:DNA-binding MarR family transcriptional regulator